MSRTRERSQLRKYAIAALVITLATLVTWVATGRDAYTKFQIVERTKSSVDADDPLAGTGFYEDEAAQEKIVVRDEFHLGLFPTPQGLFDKHMLSVASILGLTWGVWLAAWLARRMSRAARVGVSETVT